MSTVLGYGLLAAGLWCLAAAAICWLFARIVRNLAKNPRPAHPLAAEAGRARPVGVARGHHAVSSSRRGTPRSSSRLVLVQPRREEGPAAGDAAGPTNFTTP
ncbi:hypothetical protein ACTWPB_07375 [Nocardia sp. IBHARD005]|uniref:hypothetical protein n=1 Tax=Nocardia sp. IBHARD005 TaxID=3457765 RepID=UPI0040590919